MGANASRSLLMRRMLASIIDVNSPLSFTTTTSWRSSGCECSQSCRATLSRRSGSEVDRTNDGTQAVRQQHFAVQFQVFEFVNFDAHVVHNAQSAHTFDA